MNDVQAVYSGTYGTIGIDAKVLGLAAAFYGLPNQEKQSVNWIGPSSLPAVLSEEVVIGLSDVVYQVGLESDERWSCSTLPENRNGGTTHVYSEAIASMGIESVINVRDEIGSEFCIGFRDGNRIFEAIRNKISQRVHVVVSFENVRSLSAVFLESAIGQLYKGEISETNLKEYVTWGGVSPTRKLLIERAISEARESKVSN
jgi:hypothetical protein